MKCDVEDNDDAESNQICVNRTEEEKKIKGVRGGLGREHNDTEE